MNETTETLSKYVNRKQSEGKYCLELSEIKHDLKLSDQNLKISIMRLKKNGRIVSPYKGFYVIVPAEYTKVGSPPISWYIDALMDTMRLPYYVGLLSAAAMHGSSHQQPMTFQIMTMLSVRPIKTHREKIEFYTNKSFSLIKKQQIQTETGYLIISSPTATVFDLVKYEMKVGGISHIATVIKELAYKLSVREASQLSEVYPLAVCQRLGFILSEIEEHKIANAIYKHIKHRIGKIIPLAVTEPLKGETNNRWKVLVNEELELDL